MMVRAQAVAAKAEWKARSQRAWDPRPLVLSLRKQGIKARCKGFAMERGSKDALVTIQDRHLDNNLESTSFFKV